MLVDALGLSPNIQRHTVNFMGCYAAFHGLRLADMICKTDTHARVLMVSVELCSLHFTGKNNDDNLLSTYLFSDGAAACIITNKIPANGRFLRLDDFESVLLSEGKNDMAWQVGNHGFEMVLSSQVPQHVENNIALAVDKLLYKNELSRAQMAHYAIHPGGKSILKGFGRALQIEDEVLAESYKVLFEHGNMSSATIMFVLKEILENNQKSPGHIYAAAFGPGLTIESGLFSLQTTEQPKVNVAHQLNLA
jgi:predicted naringenin-chalcone synthase